MACPNSVAPRLAVEDGWKGEEEGESSKTGEEGGGEISPGETRQSHEEHMRTLAGMALSHPSNGSSIRPEPRVDFPVHIFLHLSQFFVFTLQVFYLCSHSIHKMKQSCDLCFSPSDGVECGWACSRRGLQPGQTSQFDTHL